MELKPLPRRFYQREPLAVARDLIGRLLVREVDGERLIGKVVEAEAYGPDDPASHAYRGETRRNRSMFGPPGHAYVYRSYGIHRCLNAVTLPGLAVLVRAVEPVEGLDGMARRRGLDDPRLLCAGPGRLCQAFGIDLDEDGADLCDVPGLWIAGRESAPEVAVTSRVGVTVAAERPWRFVEAGNRFASRSARWGQAPQGPAGRPSTARRGRGRR
ncbi:MAG TPA: DNA-3-methyladenine glycosylase [Actinomycetota bacterium]|nr:DNA-3-methyladenine glycosylase [Actinomycetota bacterium]